MTKTQLIALLNSLHVGEVGTIRFRLGSGAEACRGFDRPELAELLGEAGRALDESDMKTFRKRVETVIARLGHLR